MIGFKIIFSIFVFAAAVLVWQKNRANLLSGRGTTWWLLIWVAALIMVWYPNSAQVVADIFGIGRGVDLVIYSALAFLLLTIFRLSIKIETLQRDITKVVRRDALESKKNL